MQPEKRAQKFNSNSTGYHTQKVKQGTLQNNSSFTDPSRMFKDSIITPSPISPSHHF